MTLTLSETFYRFWGRFLSFMQINIFVNISLQLNSNLFVNNEFNETSNLE